MLRCSVSWYSPGSPHSSRSGELCTCAARSVCDLKAAEPANCSVEDPGRFGSYAPGPGMYAPARRSSFARMRAASSVIRSDGDRRCTVGWHRLDGGIGADSGEVGGERDGDRFIMSFIRASPRASRARAASAAPMSLGSHEPLVAISFPKMMSNFCETDSCKPYCTVLKDTGGRPSYLVLTRTSIRQVDVGTLASFDQ